MHPKSINGHVLEADNGQCNNDLIFRVGGDEFLILIDLGLGSNGRDTISMLAKKLHGNLRRKIPLTNGAIHTDASVGAGIYPDDFADIEILTKLTDRAMYCSKKNKADIFFVSDLPTQTDEQ
jgi:diguanylate cyclase (GGDEF)-like protein